MGKSRQEPESGKAAACHLEIAAIYSERSEFGKSEAAYQEALKIRQRLAQAKPQAYLPLINQTAINLLDVYITIQASAKTLLQKAALPAEWEKVNNKLYDLAKKRSSRKIRRLWW